ncbi:MAG: type III-B CRISPR module-associated protein Cmr5 [Spartobacteria bacterium]|nr:type III-B CRISPR module-associated protein Cmr5 [Spartobacteria bacterium]
MKNLEQIRAENALNAAQKAHFRGADGGSIVKKIPTMIRENGILGALAFAVEQNDKGNYKNGDHAEVFKCIMRHLNDPRIASVQQLAETNNSPEALLAYLVQSEAQQLRAITAESMAYLTYFRRFATKGN